MQQHSFTQSSQSMVWHGFMHENGLPIIKVAGCPYPTLAKENREICEMEKELFEKVVGHPLDRCSCQQDGDQCCSFQAEQDQPQNEKQNVMG